MERGKVFFCSQQSKSECFERIGRQYRITNGYLNNVNIYKTHTQIHTHTEHTHKHTLTQTQAHMVQKQIHRHMYTLTHSATHIRLNKFRSQLQN